MRHAPFSERPFDDADLQWRLHAGERAKAYAERRIAARGSPYTPPPRIRPEAIDTITLERTGCMGACPVYTLTLRRDGSAEYSGGEYATRMGRFIGRVSTESFAALANCAAWSGVWRRLPMYGLLTLDSPRSIVTVRARRRRKEVVSYSTQSPAAHMAFEYAIDAVAGQVEWRAVDE